MTNTQDASDDLRAVTPPVPNPALADRLLGKREDAASAHAPYRSSPLAGGGDRAVSPGSAAAAAAQDARHPSPTGTASPANGRPRAFSHKRSETLPTLASMTSGTPPPPPGITPPASVTPGASPAAAAVAGPPPGLGGMPLQGAKPRFRPAHTKSASLSGSGIAGLFGGQGATAQAQAEQRPSHLRHVRNRSSGGSFGSAADAASKFGGSWRDMAGPQAGKELLTQRAGEEGGEPGPRTTRNRSLSLVGAEAAAAAGAAITQPGGPPGMPAFQPAHTPFVPGHASSASMHAMPSAASLLPPHHAMPSLGGARSAGNTFVSNFMKTHSRPRAISLGFVNPNDFDDHGALHEHGSQHGEFYYDEHEMANVADQHQIPSRSLWIGNLPANITSADLMMIFNVYGSIESLRLLPERDCAFINYTSTEEAVRARDDVRGAKIGGNSIKVGFGKPDGYAQEMQNMQPTRALWVGNISANTTPQLLHSVFSPFGPIESARVLTHKNCGFVNFDNEEDAIRAKTVMNGQEIAGAIVRIGFAKVPTKAESTGTGSFSGMASMMSGSTGISGAAIAQAANVQHAANPSFSFPVNKVTSSQSVPAPINSSQANDNWRATAHPNITPVVATNEEAAARPRSTEGNKKETGGEGLEDTMSKAGAAGAGLSGDYAHTIPPLPDSGASRRIDQSRLRELRKKLDGHPSPKDVDAAYNELIGDIVELSYDYIGNTVVQKLMEKGTEAHKLHMIEKISPHVAPIGIHKNGTWAVQKMIDTAKTPAQMDEIVKYVARFTPPLMLDQFGNYVVQCCLRLGTQRNQFIFDAMHDCCWEIAQGRFGARAMRTCLESQYTTKRQQKHVSIAIVQNALQLCTNPNGALLITWLLDSSSLPGRFRVLAPRLAPHVAQLCTHKLASITILKIINQQVEPDARDVIVQALFFGADSVLEEVLGDQVHGVGVVHKILASPCVSEMEKPRIAERVKFILGKLQVSQVQGYRRLMEELGLVLMSAPGEMAAAMGAPAGSNADASATPAAVPAGGFSASRGGAPAFPPPRDPASQLAVNYSYGMMPSLVSPLDATFPTNALTPPAANAPGTMPGMPAAPAIPPQALFGAMMQQAALAAAAAQQQQQAGNASGTAATTPGAPGGSAGPTSPTGSNPVTPGSFPAGGFTAPGMFNPMFNPMMMMNPQMMQMMQQMFAQMALASQGGGVPMMPGVAMMPGMEGTTGSAKAPDSAGKKEEEKQ